MVVEASSPSDHVLQPGTTGWRAIDLNDDRLRRQWDDEHVEMVRGVIVKMPPAFFDHSYPVNQLMRCVVSHFESHGERLLDGSDIDLVVADQTVYRADGVLMSEANVGAQLEAQKQAGRSSDHIASLLSPPMIVIESSSKGHELRDLREKRRDYAAFGVPRYWILNYWKRSLTCLTLLDGSYEVETEGADRDTLQIAPLKDLSIPLAKVFR